MGCRCFAVLTTVFAGAAYSSIEKGASSWDGLWWAVFHRYNPLVTATSSPRTTAGRALGMALMLIGIGFVAVLTGAVAGRFLSARIEESQEELSETFQEAGSVERAGGAGIEIAERLNALERRLAFIAKSIARQRFERFAVRFTGLSHEFLLGGPRGLSRA